LAVVGEIDAASIEFQTQNGTAAGVQKFHRHHHHLPREGFAIRRAILREIEERQ
jgi:hypothetical protein